MCNMHKFSDSDFAREKREKQNVDPKTKEKEKNTLHRLFVWLTIVHYTNTHSQFEFAVTFIVFRFEFRLFAV